MDDPLQLLSVDPTGDAEFLAGRFEEDVVSVEIVPDRDRALEAIHETDVDCVVSAHDLPDGDGIDLCRRVRDRDPSIDFVLLPVAGDEALASEAVAAGVDGYVPRSAPDETIADRILAATTGDSTSTEVRDTADGGDARDAAGIASTTGRSDIGHAADAPATSGTIGTSDTTGEDDPVDRFRHFEQSPIAIVELDLDFEVVNWNPAAEDLFGYDRSTALGQPAPDLIVPESIREFVVDGWNSVVETAEPSHEINEAVRADGTTITCDWHTAPIVQGDEVGEHADDRNDGTDDDGTRGDVTSVVSFVRDVTNQVRRSSTLEALQGATPCLLRDSKPEQVAETTISMARSVLGHGLVTVRLYDDRTGTLQLAASSQAAENLLTTTDPVPPDEGLLGAVWESGRRRVYDHLPAADTVHGDRFPVESAIVEPLGEHGLLTVGSTTPEAFEPLDVHFADVLAATTEAALDRTAIAGELRKRTEKIENLHAVVDALDECETEAEIWDLAVDAAEGVLQFDECGVDEVVDGRFVSRGTSSGVLPSGYVETAPIDDGIAGETYRTGETHVVDDLREVVEAVPEDDRYRSILSVPVGDVGIFQAVSTDVAAFDENDVDLAELLVAHVANEIERVRFETDLREERDRFAALFENVPDPVVFAEHRRPETIVRSVNPAFESVFGFDESTIRGENINALIVPPGRQREATEIDAAIEAGETIEREVKRRTAEGLRDFLLTVVPVDVGDDEQWNVGVYTDITERKQREQRVEVLNRVLRHDLRNGMNIIKGSAEMLASAVDESDEQYARIIVERADELLGMAEKTRSVGRTLEHDVRSGSLELVESVDRAIDVLRQEYPGATFEIDAPEAALVVGEDLLETAIHHVLENACTHNDRTPVVEITIEERDDRFFLAIADNGPGIPEAERELLVEDREITQLRHASGLGLWLVNWVVTQAGGTIDFRDNAPRGSIVELRLPKLAGDPEGSERTADGTIDDS
jgi:PAS domain S-box-containing protein